MAEAKEKKKTNKKKVSGSKIQNYWTWVQPKAGLRKAIREWRRYLRYARLATKRGNVAQSGKLAEVALYRGRQVAEKTGVLAKFNQKIAA